MGFSVYVAMGFQTVVPYATFRHPSTDTVDRDQPHAQAR
jgi:hypothetical protein